MEIKDFYYILSALVMVVGGIGSLVNVYWSLKNRIALLAQDLENEKKRNSDLATRLQEHENKVEGKLDEIIKSIGLIRETIAKS